jgi:hypothetical protein
MEKRHDLIAYWQYDTRVWDEFVTIEKGNKREDNIYFGIGIVIISTLCLMFFRSVSFWMGLLFSVPLAILIPWLRMIFSYSYLKKGVKNPEVKIFRAFLLINTKKIVLRSNRRSIKSIKVIDAREGLKLLEFTVEWTTAKGPTHDEFRILIPERQLENVNSIIQKLY